MRAEGMIVWSERPLNAETPVQLLRRFEVTPVELFFIRNHGSIPAVDAAEYRLTLDGEARTPVAFSLRELRERFPRATVTATLACAGNRRCELSPAPDGIPWGPGAIGNATWTGIRLRDVLLAAGIAPDARHVAFTGLDDVDGEPFGGSIPLEKALAPEVLLACEMNGAPLSAEHGFPVRLIVPGYIGARSVKWLTAISIQQEPSANFFQRSDYMLDGAPLGELPLTSAACWPREGAAVRGGTIRVEGYATGVGGRPVERVEVSCDGGRTWLPAVLRGAGEPWTWRLWRATVDAAPRTHEVVVRAWDGSDERQPEQALSTPSRNPKGYMNNAWHRVRLTSAPSDSSIEGAIEGP